MLKIRVALIPSYLYVMHSLYNNILLERWGKLTERKMQCKQKITQYDSKENKQSDKPVDVCVKGTGSGICSPIKKRCEQE